MYTVVIVDDEPLAIDGLRQIIRQFFKNRLQVVETFSHAAEALEYLSLNPVDFMLVDIQMPGMNGLELVSKLENKNIRIVFTTAHRQYAIDALRLGAFDYLLKPIDIADLRRVVNNMELVSPDISAQYQLAIKGRMEHMGGQFKSRPISISFQGGIEFVFPIEIVYCESDVNYTHVYLNSGRKIIVSKTLKSFGDELQEDLFIRCHKSFIVNRMYVSKYLRLEQHYLQLLNDARIPVSSRKREYTQDALQGRTMD